MISQPVLWIGFHLLIIILLGLDLGVFHRKAKVIKIKEALLWSGVWITISLLFNLFIYVVLGSAAGLQFFTGYLIEKSLSIDNIFIFALIFSQFSLKKEYQHLVLYWGIIGALIFRISLILAGVALIEKFQFILYILGAFLLFTGIRIAVQKEKKPDFEKNPLVKFVKRFFPVVETEGKARLFIKKHGKWCVTTFFIALLLIESFDIIFALDSVPAIFAITKDPFIIYTSNVFAILGLRSLYFVLAHSLHKFHFVKIGLGAILAFIGTKMLIEGYYEISTAVSLGVISFILALAIVGSIYFPKKISKA